MISLLRVDHRLLHGQVAFSWTNALGADSILIANDDVINDDIWKTTLRLAKPAGIKLVIKNIEDSIESLNSGVTDKYKLLIVVRTIEDAKRLADGCKDVKSINLGGTINSPESKQISKAVFVTDRDEQLISELIASGIEVEIRQLFSDAKQIIER